MDKQKLILRIAKLLALSRGNQNEAEAYAALCKAQELALDARISFEEVEQAEEKNDQTEPTEEGIASGKRYVIWKSQIARICAKNFRCEYFLTPGWRTYPTRYIFFGMPLDAASCAEAFKFALRVCEQLYTDYQIETAGYYGKTPKGLKLNYTRGFTDGLAKAFEKNVEDKALIIVKPDAVITAYREKQKDFTTLRSSARMGSMGEGYAQGFKDGNTATNQHERIRA